MNEPIYIRINKEQVIKFLALLRPLERAGSLDIFLADETEKYAYYILTRRVVG